MTAPPDTPPAEIEQDAPPGEGINWGRVMDAAGIVAGILLIAIVIDVWTEGRFISRRLIRQPPADSEQVPGEH
jgi:hypothetical protein